MEIAMFTVISESEADTVRFGEKIAAKLKKGDIIALTGDLGTGKTAFVKGLARGLGVAEYVTSPTFTLVQSYKGRDVSLHHFDVYRISDEEEMFEIGFNEYLYENDICVIEWADLIKNLIPPRAIWIHFERTEDGADKRRITVKGLESE
ncbi:putative ATP/GTP hydrolase [Thermoclostridium stercorarium subsp. stercorarium DSM 8532]|uniref:tRNA threonylcarbamoyladenosine biosynthesis protein TsaE n=3 Tax=Thermoclostridium stercorarium TaxID=1510 RepID=L7VSL8_THES1|nr:putative ATP/GTP hydrolase [Thermoclostridium stercorarium subsp. stercorarium DSM 8532]